MNNDIYGYFLKDFYFNRLNGHVWLHNNYGEAEEMPVESFFRSREEMPDIEIFALNLCKGRVLDIGAGAGVHTLLLQEYEFDVTAIELSEGACEVMKLRGIHHIINRDIMTYSSPEKFDTLLLMMNGIGFCGYLDELKSFLHHAKSLINNNGQILFDSSDVRYLYEDEEPEPGSYYGEIDYQYEYDKKKGDWFSWLYIDQKLMNSTANECGWNLQVIYEDDQDHYLGRLTLIH
jgi:SAM-dependent methyltransferase